MTPYHAKYYACELTKRCPSDSLKNQLQQLSDEVGTERTLLELCTAFRARAVQFPNLTVKTIPKVVLARCEWGHDDYSLQVENLPQASPEPGQVKLFGDET